MKSTEAAAIEDAPIEQACPDCGKPLRIPVRLAGEFDRCTHCGERVVVESGQLRRKSDVTEKRSSRLLSIDVLRGFNMFWIIGADALGRALQKVGGGDAAPPLIKAIARQLDHVGWEGFVFYDLIFPLFVFIVGMSTVFSLGKLVEKHGAASAINRILRRAALLFILGAAYDFIDSFYHDGFAKALEENLICGVLQRIALCYLFTGIAVCLLRARGIVVTFMALLICYWAALTFVPVPGETQVFIEKGHNIIHYLDKKIPPYYAVDPEGLMSTFPAVASCLLGALTAMFMKQTSLSKNRQVVLFVAVGLGITCLGYLWGMQIPIIKRLWTPSYVFVAGGYSMALLGIFIWLIDIREWTWWIAPFLWIGSNSIAAYFFHGIMKLRGWAWLIVGKDKLPGGLDAALAIGELVLTIAFLHYLYKKKIFIRV